MRHDGRRANQLREFTLKRHYTSVAPGSVLVGSGGTRILVTASVENRTPPWLKGEPAGWITAEYNMLPGSTSPRKARDRGPKLDGRTVEIQRLIGRSLRAAVDLKALGQCTITVDCDVLQADGGTRTASITGGFVALVDAVRSLPLPAEQKARVFKSSVAAVSVGLVGSLPVMDLDYQEDSTAVVDMNVVMNGKGEFIEVQGTGEGGTFSQRQLDALLKVAKQGVIHLTKIQKSALKRDWPV